MKFKSLAFLAIPFALIVASCGTPKNTNYLSHYQQDSSHTYIYQSFEVPIQVGDELAIMVSAINPQSAIPYNSPSKSITVEQDGRIVYPQLGLIRAEGLTRTQLRDVLVARLKTYLTDPVVTVDFVNFKITVLGEVHSPGTKPVPDGKINILEAIAQAGDLTQYAKKYPVMVIRENKGRREFGYLNLLSTSIFSSPYYRLQQNDIVYVEAAPGKPDADQEILTRRISLATTILSIATTVTFLIITLTRL